MYGIPTYVEVTDLVFTKKWCRHEHIYTLSGSNTAAAEQARQQQQQSKHNFSFLYKPFFFSADFCCFP
jgi:hypothetical protein